VEKDRGAAIWIGSKATIEFDDGEQMTLEIVGAEESDPQSGKISYQSPLGQTLMGARVGEMKNYSVDGQEIRVKIISF
jgi:transcription elongation GreA/GreB family factor